MAKIFTIDFWAPAYAPSFSDFYPDCEASLTSTLGKITSQGLRSDNSLGYRVVVEYTDQEALQTGGFVLKFTYGTGNQPPVITDTTRGTLTKQSVSRQKLEVYVPMSEAGKTSTTGMYYQVSAYIRYWDGSTQIGSSTFIKAFELANTSTGGVTVSTTLQSVTLTSGRLVGYSKVKNSTTASYQVGQSISETLTYADRYIDVYAVKRYTIKGTAVFYHNYPDAPDSGFYTSATGENTNSTATTGTVYATMTDEPTRTNYRFDGWYKDAACTDGPFTSAFAISGNTSFSAVTNFYAKWTQTHWAVWGQATFYDIDGDYFTTVAASSSAFEGTSGYIEKDVAIPDNTTYYKFTGYQQKNAASNTATLASESATTIKVKIPVGLADMGGITSEFICLTEQIAWDIGYTLKVYNGHTNNNNVSTYYPKKKASSKKQEIINQTLPQPQTSNIDQDKYYFDKWIETSTSGSAGEYAAGSDYPGLATTNYPPYTLSGRWLPYYDIGFSYHYKNASSGVYPSASTVTLPQNYSYRNQKSKSATNEITRVLYPATTTDSNYKFAYWIDQFDTKYYMDSRTNSYSKTFTANEDRIDYILTAVWQRKVYCTIEFQDTVFNHGTQTGWPSDKPLTAWSNPGTNTYTDDNLTFGITSPTSDNYIFDGWAINSTTQPQIGTITVSLTYTDNPNNSKTIYAYWTEKLFTYKLAFFSPDFTTLNTAYSNISMGVATTGGTSLTVAGTSSGAKSIIKTFTIGYTKISANTQFKVWIDFTENSSFSIIYNADYVTFIDAGHDGSTIDLTNYITENSSRSYLECVFPRPKDTSEATSGVLCKYWYKTSRMGIALKDYYGADLYKTLFPTNGTTISGVTYLPVEQVTNNSGNIYISAKYTAPAQQSTWQNAADFNFIGWTTNSGQPTVDNYTGQWTPLTSKTISLYSLQFQNNSTGITYYEAGYLRRIYQLRVLYDRDGGLWPSIIDSNDIKFNIKSYPNDYIFEVESYSVVKATVPFQIFYGVPYIEDKSRSFNHWEQIDGRDTLEYQAGQTSSWESTTDTLRYTSQDELTTIELKAIYWYDYYATLQLRSTYSVKGYSSTTLKTVPVHKQSPSSTGYTFTPSEEDLTVSPALVLEIGDHYQHVGWHKNQGTANYTFVTKPDTSYTFTLTHGQKPTLNLWAAFRCLHRYRATLKLDLNGGKSDTIKDIVMPKSGVAYWDEVTETTPKFLRFSLPAVSATNPVKLGYYCIDWSKKKDSETDRIKDTTYSITPKKDLFPLDDKIYEITETLYAFYKPITWTLTVVYNANTTKGDGKANGLATPLKVTKQTFKYTYDPANEEANKQIYENTKYKFKVTIPDQEPKCNNTEWYFLEWNILSDTSKDRGSSYLPKKTYDIQAYGDYESTTRPAKDYNLYAIWTQGTIVWIYVSQYGGWCKAIPYINGAKAQAKIWETYSGKQEWR